MQDISLHLLDIIENSARADSKNIWIDIYINVIRNKMVFKIKDDGKGMDEETLKNAQDPFYTSKEERTKKVGLGIPLFKQNAENCGGSFSMKSKIDEGTELEAVFAFDHIDRMPLGNLKDTLIGAIIGHEDIDIHVHLERKEIETTNTFDFSTATLKEELGDIPLTYPDVISFIDQMLEEGIKNNKMEEL